MYVVVTQAPPQKVEEAMGHGLNTNHYAKQTMDVMHVGEVDDFANRRPTEGIVDVVSFAQEQHHVKRIVEEGRASGQGQ